jgi:glycerophosphoryl diester phosphodiesterase
VACGYLAAGAPEGDDVRLCTLVLHHEYILRTTDLVGRAAAKGRTVWAYTVDEVEIAARLAALGVEAIVTNHPERFLPRPRAAV